MPRVSGIRGVAGDVVFCVLCGHDVLGHEAVSGSQDVFCPLCPDQLCPGLETRARFDAPAQPG